MKIKFVVISLFITGMIPTLVKAQIQQELKTSIIPGDKQLVRADERVCSPSRAVVINGNVYTSVDELPEFPGGMKNFYRFIDKKLQYPAEAGGITGRVILTFVVNQDGSLSNIEPVGRMLHPALTKEALRVMKEMPKWNPGKINRKPVRTQYTVPIVFTK